MTVALATGYYVLPQTLIFVPNGASPPLSAGIGGLVLCYSMLLFRSGFSHEKDFFPQAHASLIYSLHPLLTHVSNISLPATAAPNILPFENLAFLLTY